MLSYKNKRAVSNIGERLLGQTIDRRYTLLEVIGRGGMGCVYKAHQVSLNRHVAIKILSRESSSSRKKEFQLRFLKEAATSARLQHPNTITVFDYGSEVMNIDGKEHKFFYISMEYLDGLTLSQVLKEKELSLYQKINIILQISRSLREAHSVGVVHRDLKPSNIMLIEQEDSEEYIVKVLDFGLAKTFSGGFEDESLTREGMFLGSPRYVSPEQISGGYVDYRSDIYALGCLMYRILEGRVPFNASSSADIMLLHLNEKVAPFTRKRPNKLEHLVFSCLEKSVEKRPQKMSTILQDLKEIRFEHEELMHHSKSWKTSKAIVENDHSEDQILEKETEILKKINRKDLSVKIEKKQITEHEKIKLTKDFSKNLPATDSEWNEQNDSLLPGFSDADYGTFTIQTDLLEEDECAASSDYDLFKDSIYDAETEIEKGFWGKLKNAILSPFKSSI